MIIKLDNTVKLLGYQSKPNSGVAYVIPWPLIRNVIYQNVCPDKQFSKTVPVNFFDHFSRSRSKVKSQPLKIRGLNS